MTSKRRTPVALTACLCQMLLFFALLHVAVECRLAAAAEFIPLGTLPGYSLSEANGVSDDGTVVVAYAAGPSINQVFRWTAATGPGSVGTLPGEINARYGPRGHQPLSADGSTVVGRSGAAFRYTTDGGISTLGINTKEATGVSADGSAVIGWSGDYGVPSAFRWTEPSGAQTLALLPGYTWSLATDVTLGGDLIVGLTGNEHRDEDRQEIFRWTEDSGTEGTRIFATGFVDPVAKVTDNGAVISSSGYVSSLDNVEAFYWTDDTGIIPLGWLHGPRPFGNVHSAVRDMTPDGRIIVGWSGDTSGGVSPFVWTEEAGMEDFQQTLTNTYGLADALQDWQLTSINAVSSNGQFFVGYSNENPTGERAAWLVRLDAPWGSEAVPEPNSMLLVMLALLPLTTLRRTR